MKLLIVDDSLVIRNKIGRCLLSRFPSIYRASDGLKAVDIVKQETPDVVTMDLTMPNMGGVAAVEEILSIAPKTAILVVSALADKQTAIEALTKGANGFLCKPFTQADLTAAIEKVISLRARS